MAGALRWRNIVLLGVVMLLSVVGLSVYRILDMYERIPEAYAAWDTGTLLVAYMEQHDGKWPKSWDDLLTVLDSPAGQQIPLRGAQSGDRTYVRSLAHMIQIDWTFDPEHPAERQPVSLIGGGAFTMVWGDHEPNRMVREYLAKRTRAERAKEGM